MAAATNHTPLLNLLWRLGHLAGHEFDAVTGERTVVVAGGESADSDGVWTGAEVVVDGERRRGLVVVGEDVPMPDGTVLRVVCGDARPVLGSDDRLVPQIRYRIEPEIAGSYDSLLKGAADYECSDTIAEMSPVHRTALFTRLLVERLQRKYDDIMRIFARSDGDWNQTFYVMLLRVMGGNKNREAYMSLAGRVTQVMLSREKSFPERLESMLLGGGGFLFAGGEGAVKDDYILRLEDEFRHLAAKYSIVPLKPAEWDIRVRASNFPELRLAEIAALFAKKDFVLGSMLACRSVGDVEALLGVEASEYWNTHSKPGVEYGLSPKRIGRTKSALIGINLAVPLMFAYGKQTGDETMCERALDLLATIPAEKNSIVNGWYARGCTAGSAVESQALLQLSNEYCSHGGCAACNIGRGEIKKTAASTT